ncbi:hypothetical protein HanRHA438_Chr15g0715401 [Helianthus annuus]|nr:hypothetical protein HanRHA438_Chr15g0715401 [Helianthus annuus]
MKFPLQCFSKSSPVPLDCSRLPIPARMGSGVVTVKVVSELSHCFKPISVVITILKLK